MHDGVVDGVHIQSIWEIQAKRFHWWERSGYCCCCSGSCSRAWGVGVFYVEKAGHWGEASRGG